MNSTTVPDLTTSFPRSGRTIIGGYAWLARLADKVRADHAGTNGEYIAYCGLSMGFLERAGVSEADVDALITDGKSDDQLVSYFDAHVDEAHKEAANAYVLKDMASHLDEQDAEEGHT